MINSTLGIALRKLQESGLINSWTPKDDIEEKFIRLILGIPDDVARREDIEALFGTDYEPGTFMISEIKGNPNFFPVGERLGFDLWVKQEIRSDIKSMKNFLILGGNNGIPLEEVTVEDIEQEVLKVLNYRLKNGRQLCELIPLQEYTDIFRRIILLLTYGNPELEINTYRDLDLIGRELAFAKTGAWRTGKPE